jgi:hypothetical protein
MRALFVALITEEFVFLPVFSPSQRDMIDVMIFTHHSGKRGAGKCGHE